MKFVNIDETNQNDFAPVLPGELNDGTGVAIGAVEGDVVCGAVSLSFDGEEYNIDWLYVVPSMRRKGIAKGLIREVQSMVAEIGLCPIRMLISASDDSGLYGFALSLEDEDHPIDVSYSHDRYTITTDDFLRSPAIQKISGQDMGTTFQTEPFWSMDQKSIEASLSSISRDFSVFDEDKFAESCEKDLCPVVKRNDKIEAFVLVQREDAGNLKLSYVYANKPLALACAFHELAAALQKYDTPQTVFFDTVTDKAVKLAEKLFCDAEKEFIYEVEL